MNAINDTSLRLAWFPGRLGFPDHSLTIVAKGTYALSPDGTATPIEEEPEELSGEVYDAGPGTGCSYGGDFAFFKPRADVTLVGTCYSPGGVPRDTCAASFAVGNYKKSVLIQGDSHWEARLLGARLTDPEPFTTMPLGYANAFGGEGFAANPIGKGFGKSPNVAGKSVRHVPNVQQLDELVTAPSQRPEPAGFGPIDPMWEQRMQGMGTYGARWQAERWPWFPDDFDWGMQNAAPRDQQLQGYLRGDEALEFENLHPDHPIYRTKLPGLRVRCLLQELSEAPQPPRREVDLVLDTLWVDMDAGRLVLVWRGSTPIESQKFTELDKVMLATEDLASPPAPTETFFPLFEEDGEEIVAEEPEPEAPAAGGEPPKTLEEMLAAAKAEVVAELEQMRARQPAAGAGIDQAKAILLAADPAAAVDALVEEMGIDKGAYDRLQAAQLEKTREIFERFDLDTSLLDDPVPAPPPTPAAPLTRADIEGEAAGGSLVGRDLSGLDLRGADLSGVDLTDALLIGTILTDADLSGANLGGATLEGADFTKAILSGAVLTEADLTNARLDGANLANATLDGAVCTGIRAGGAILRGVHAGHALFQDADLSAGELQGAHLDGVDFDGADLTDAVLDGASLVRASMGTAQGPGASFRGANLTELRAGDECAFARGKFTTAMGEGSIWCSADLRGADFSGAVLPRSDFTKARLDDAELSGADLSGADLTEAQLTAARLHQTNLFQARLKEADLTRTSLVSSNCFQAEFWDAVLEETDFLGANLKMTKIAHLAR